MRMNLEDTWKNCLSMWRWIAKKVRNGNPVGEDEIGQLKEEWLEHHGFEEYLEHDCFFCHYDTDHDGGCGACPGRLIDSGFRCNNLDSYDLCWFDFPIGFYNRIVSLNRKRLKAKK